MTDFFEVKKFGTVSGNSSSYHTGCRICLYQSSFYKNADDYRADADLSGNFNPADCHG